MRVQVDAYNPVWRDQFLVLKKELETILQGTSYLSIEHVGSTSVPGLAAKPVLDIDIVVQPEQLPGVIEVLTTRGGYIHIGQQGIPDREAFRKGDSTPARNLYACIAGSQALRNHLAVREICTRNNAVREAYAQKKLELAGRDWRDVNEYAEAKTDILQWVLQHSDFSQKELDDIRANNTTGL